MNQREQWTDVDRYITDLLVPHDAALDEALRASQDAGLPAINVSANQGKLLYLLAQMRKARNILEIGTLGGYSTIWLARAIREVIAVEPELIATGKPSGLITLESEPKHADIARANITRAGVGDIVELILGRALDTLPQLVARGPFDLVFVDADKQSTAEYFDWAVRLAHPGSVIIVDNVVRSGAVTDTASTDAGVKGVRRFMDALSRDKRVTATAIQTVGSKGYDGFAVAMVVDAN